MSAKEHTQVSKIEKIEFDNGLVWTNITEPDENAVRHLAEHYKFHQLDLDDCISENQRAKIDEYDDYLFIVLHFPILSKKKDVEVSELNLFIGPKFLITLYDKNPDMDELFENCHKNKTTREEFMGKGSGYLLYTIIDELFGRSFPLIDDIAKQINIVEKEVFNVDDARDRLKEILSIKKDIINFRRMMMPQRTIVAQLEFKNKKFLPEKLEVYFDNVVDKVEKIWNNLENLHDLISSLHDTNEAIISHNTNNVIKILTLFSVIMLPLTVITGFYGMNIVNLPAANHPLAPGILMGVIVAVIVSMLVYFKVKKWI